MFFTANITFTFTWYANGNVFSDGNMTVAYYDNRLNLPTYISLSGNRVIRNTYAADGRKLYTDVRERNVLQDGTRYYNGNLVFDKNKELDYILFDEGRILHENGNFAFEYHLKDHLGSVRVAFVPTVNGKEVVQENAYYPFGATIGDLSYAAPLNNNRYGYTGQEQLNDFDLNWYDYIARNYNPLIGRFNSIDPLAEKYYSISPYAYCANNPVNAIDSDGRLVIFINGMHTGTGGTKNYWGDNGAFANAAMKHLNDNNAIYRDGSVGGWSNIFNNRSAAYRISRGKDQAKLDAANILKLISDKDGNITETIKIITHSMGGAYAKGYVKALLEYLKENSISMDILEFEADFAPFQPTNQKAVDGVDTYQFSHSKDWVAGNNRIEGAQYMDTSKDSKQEHWINTFINQIQNLPEGKYKVVDGKIVPY